MKRYAWLITAVLLCIASFSLHAEPDRTADEAQQQNLSSQKKSKSPQIAEPDLTTGLIQVTLGLFVVLLIIAAAAWLTRRFGNFQVTAGGNMRIIGGMHLGAKERVVVVQVGEEQLLLGVAPGRVSTLHVLPKPLPQTQGQNRDPNNFLSKLNAALKGGRQ